MEGECRILASMMCARLERLEADVRALEAAGIDGFHVDMVDGRFSDTLALGFPTLAALRRCTNLPLDVHLMVAEPLPLLAQCADAGAAAATIHLEVCTHLNRVLRGIGAQGLKPGVALGPTSPVEPLLFLDEEPVTVLLMAVEPGYSGGRFLPSAIRKCAEVRALIESRGWRSHLAVDGHICPDTVRSFAHAGADTFVGGTTGLFVPNRDFALCVADLRAAYVGGRNGDHASRNPAV